MRHRFALAAVAVALGAACPSTDTYAQSNDIPCDAFEKNDDGSWSATRNVTIAGPGQNITIRQGSQMRLGATILGMDVAEQLNKQNCPATSEAAPAPGQAPAQGTASAPAAAPPAPIALSKYADSNGEIDAQKLTCAQLANATQDEADFFGFWYSGWYNGLAKKHTINVQRVREGFRDVLVYCRANKDKKIIQAIDIIRKQGRR